MSIIGFVLLFGVLGLDSCIGSMVESVYHPCNRDCSNGEKRVCLFDFNLEHFVTMSSSCRECSINRTRIQLEYSPHCQCAHGDGFERGVLTINRMLPGPSVQVCEGDMVVVDINNMMEGADTTIHWHGQRLVGNPFYDGVPFVTQCPIAGGSKFRYKFKADNSGTHFYHAHSGGQKLDGLYGSFIVRPPHDPQKHLYDYDLPEHTLIISDLYHGQWSDRMPGYTHGETHYPDTLMFNGFSQAENVEFTRFVPFEQIIVEPGKRYRLRLINSMGSNCDARFSIEDHPLLVIATDGGSIVPFTVDTLTSYSGERYDVVIETHKHSKRSYWMEVVAESCANVQQVGIVRYGLDAPSPLTPKPSSVRLLPRGKTYRNLCTSGAEQCINTLRSNYVVDPDILKPEPDQVIYIPFELTYYTGADPFLPNTYHHFAIPPSGKAIASLIDGISFVAPRVPPLTQPEDLEEEALCNRNHHLPKACNRPHHCMCPHTVHIELGNVVEIVLVDVTDNRRTNMTHAFHLHGNGFHVLDHDRIPFVTDRVSKEDIIPKIRKVRRRLEKGLITNPVMKDTITIRHDGYAILRAKMTNPGYWFFHCHYILHMLIGMNMIFHVGEHSDLPEVPQGFPRCGDFLPPI